MLPFIKLPLNSHLQHRLYFSSSLSRFPFSALILSDIHPGTDSTCTSFGAVPALTTPLPLRFNPPAPLHQHQQTMGFAGWPREGWGLWELLKPILLSSHISQGIHSRRQRSPDAVQGASQAVLGFFYHPYSTKNGSSLKQAGR